MGLGGTGGSGSGNPSNDGAGYLLGGSGSQGGFGPVRVGVSGGEVDVSAARKRQWSEEKAMLLMRIRELEHENARLVTRVNDSVTAAGGGAGAGGGGGAGGLPQTTQSNHNDNTNPSLVLREATSIVDRETQPPLSLYDPPSSVASSLSQQHALDTHGGNTAANAHVSTAMRADQAPVPNPQMPTDFKKIDLRESHFSPPNP